MLRSTRVVSLLVMLLSLLWSLPGTAAPRDSRAKELSRQAMEEDYLATNMDAAIDKLQEALELCGKRRCSKKVVAEIHGNMGTVYAAGLARHQDAVRAFKKMLKADRSAKPDPTYLTGDVQRAFDAAKGGGGSTSSDVAELEESPASEQATDHPIPVFVEMPEGLEAASVTVRYRTPGAKDWREVKLRKHKSGFGGYIPCTATSRTGKLSYFVTAFDTNLDRIAAGGSATDPRVVEIKQELDDDPPRLPGTSPPSPCPKGSGLSCETDADCPKTESCIDFSCKKRAPVSDAKLDEEDDEDEEEAPGGARLNWLSVAFSPDLMFVSSTDDACSPEAQQDGKLSCFFAGGVQYQGTPISGGSSNSVQGGIGTGSMRVMLGFDRVLGKQITLGGKLGFAFLGYPQRADGKSFLPIHAEARFAFYLGKDPFSRTGVRPYLFANGGVAEASARVNTSVTQDDGTGETDNFNLDVYQRAGPGFVGGGVGIAYAVSQEAALIVELGGRATLPVFAPVIAPSIGFAYGL